VFKLVCDDADVGGRAQATEREYIIKAVLIIVLDHRSEALYRGIGNRGGSGADTKASRKADREKGRNSRKRDLAILGCQGVSTLVNVANASFINANHTQSLIGRAMHAACVYSKVNDRFQESLYIILEMMRAGVVHGGRFSDTLLSGGPSFGTEEEQSSNLLIMRCLCVLPLNYRVSRDQRHCVTETCHRDVTSPRVPLMAASTMGRSLVARAPRLQLVQSSSVKVAQAVV
jgi:hypothetical protein